MNRSYFRMFHAVTASDSVSFTGPSAQQLLLSQTTHQASGAVLAMLAALAQNGQGFSFSITLRLSNKSQPADLARFCCEWCARLAVTDLGGQLLDNPLRCNTCASGVRWQVAGAYFM